MSDYTDYMEEQFFGHVADVRMRIDSKETWIKDYTSKRESYPCWTTRDGQQIKVENVTDSHLENLLNFLPEKNVWHRIFECEKLYRKFKKEISELKKESKHLDDIINKVF